MQEVEVYSELIDQKNDRFLPLRPGRYTECRFININFTNSDLSKRTFIDCVFQECDMSLLQLKDCGMQNAQFTQCRLMGVRFDQCKPFLLKFTFDNCLLDLASFAGLKIPETQFNNSSLRETDFSKTDLSGSLFRNCNLERAVFSGTNLQSTDLTSAFNLTIDPEVNNIRKAKFTIQSLPGLLTRYNIEIHD